METKRSIPRRTNQFKRLPENHCSIIRGHVEEILFKRTLEVIMGILSFILFLFVAAACAYLAERLVPGSIPGGFLTSAIVGIIGAWIGGSMVGSIGPSLAGVSLLPCILGSALLVFLLSLFSHRYSRRSVV
jgi:uncharacterized membrane protein YeaQ/YmgE (transglycosylase-associated protein family)